MQSGAALCDQFIFSSWLPLAVLKASLVCFVSASIGEGMADHEFYTDGLGAFLLLY